MSRAFRRPARDHTADDGAAPEDVGEVVVPDDFLFVVFFAVDFLLDAFFVVVFFAVDFLLVAFFAEPLPAFFEAGAEPGNARATALLAAAATAERVVSRFLFTCSS